MRIERVLLRTLRLPYRKPRGAANGTGGERTLLLVQVEGDGVQGVAECVAGETPHEAPETVMTAGWVLERHLIPAVLGCSFNRAEEVGPVLDRAARGHRMAKAALEMAVWDAEARGRGESLAALLGEVRDAVPAGAVVGLHGDEAALLDGVDAALAEGYRRIELKIAPGRDLEPLDAIRARHPSILLAVSADGAYSAAHMKHLSALDGHRLLYVSQPFGVHDLVEHSALRSRLLTPVCLDQSVTSPGRCREALALGACEVVNLNPGRVGGHGPSRTIHDLCRDAGVPVWCGGRAESGVGRAHNVAAATLPNMRLPGNIAASDRYWERDIVAPVFELREDGTVGVPTGAGIGVELDEEFVRSIEIDRVELRQGGR